MDRARLHDTKQEESPATPSHLWLLVSVLALGLPPAGTQTLVECCQTGLLWSSQQQPVLELGLGCMLQLNRQRKVEVELAGTKRARHIRDLHSPPPPCDILSGCCFFTGPWTVTRSSLRMLRRVAAACVPAGVVFALAEPSSWCTGAVLLAAGVSQPLLPTPLRCGQRRGHSAAYTTQDTTMRVVDDRSTTWMSGAVGPHAQGNVAKNVVRDPRAGGSGLQNLNNEPRNKRRNSSVPTTGIHRLGNDTGRIRGHSDRQNTATQHGT